MPITSAPFAIPNEKARALILARTGLSDARADGSSGAVAPLIRRLGYVQLDPIRVVERAHHHILFARNSAYRPKHLERLQAKEPPLFFENWTHDSSLIPIESYRIGNIALPPRASALRNGASGSATIAPSKWCGRT